MESHCSNKTFVSSLACVLTHLVSLASEAEDRLTRFHAVRAPSITIEEYLCRINKYFACSPECFVLCLIYIDRIIKQHSEFVVSKLNIHRLVVTSVMLAVKFFDDVYYSNAFYAKVGGVKTREVNALEAHFLKLIDWQLYVSVEEFDQYKNHVLLAISGEVTPPTTGTEETE